MNDIRRRVENLIGTDLHLQNLNFVDQVQLACDLEEEFKISISDQKLQGCESLDDVSKYIESLVTAKA